MRVAIVGTRGFPYVYSGYETFVSHVAPALAARGHQVTVYCHRSLFASRPNTVEGVHLVYVPGIPGKSLSQLSHTFSSTVHAMWGGYDVVLAVNSANAPFGWMLGLRGIPCAINVDGMEWLRPKWRGIGARYFRWASALSGRSFDQVITDAKAMAAVYQREFGISSAVIEYGADIAENREPSRVEEVGVRPGNYYLIVGRLVPDNNADILIDGFLKARSSHSLVVVGDVPYSDDYAARVKAKAGKNVIFTGYVRDGQLLRDLYNNAHGYLHGHEYGGTNPALLTALGWGAPVLALDTVFSREVLEDGRCGMLMVKDPHSIAQSIRTFDATPTLRSAFQERGRRRIKDWYNWPRVVDEYEKLLLALAASRRAPLGAGADS